jgi:divalent metal cation (Fe/Co/Zn/Cd) transporter
MYEIDKIKKDAFKKQSKVSFIHICLEIPYIIFSIVMAAMSGSIMMMMDSIDSIVNLFHTQTIFVVSRKLQKSSRFRYDYGMGKIEAFGAFLASLFLYGGFLLVIGSSITAFFAPIRPKDMLIVAIIVKILVIIMHFEMYAVHKKLEKTVSSRIISAGKVMGKKNFIFYLISLMVTIISFTFREGPLVIYFEPLVCIILAIILMVMELKPTRESVYELLDQTLDEDKQNKILKCVAPITDRFEDFKGIRTRVSGELIYVELLIGFNPESTYAEIEGMLGEFSASVRKEIPESVVSIVIT